MEALILEALEKQFPEIREQVFTGNKYAAERAAKKK